MMPRLTKSIKAGMIAAAKSDLACIHECAAESFNGAHACYMFHTEAANRHLATLAKAGEPVPAWIASNAKYFSGALRWKLNG